MKAMQKQKPAIFIDGSRRTLRDFPDLARWLAGNEINELQWGRMPEDWKPMSDIGPGALEIRRHQRKIWI